MWPLISQLGLNTLVALLVATWMLAAVEGYLIDDLLECKRNISATYEEMCAKYNEHKESFCDTVYETARCLVEKACKDCLAEVAKRYAEWKDNWMRIEFNDICAFHLQVSRKLIEYCPNIKPGTLPSSMFSITGVTEVTDITSQPKQSKSALLIILAVILVLLLLTGLAIWCICYRRGRKLTTGRRSEKKSMKSTTMSNPNSPTG